MMRDLKIVDIKVIKTGYGSNLNLLTENHDTLQVIMNPNDFDQAILKSLDELKDSLIYVERILWGENHDYLKPLHDKENALNMFGGNYGKFKNEMTLKIHDRYETQEKYNMCSH